MKVRVVLLLVAIAVLACVPLVTTEYWTFVGALVGIYAIAGLGLTVLTGWTGQIALAAAGIMGIGAYTTAILCEHGVPWPLAVIASIVLAAIAGGVVGLPAVRLEGFYLAIATLAFGELVVQILTSWGSLTGGAAGLTVNEISLAGLTPVASIYYVLLIAVVVVHLGASWVGHARWGWQLRAVRDIEVATPSLGLRPARIKLLAFMASAALAGLAGAFYAILLGFLAPTVFELGLVIQILVVSFLGGIRNVTGPIFGAVVVVAVRQEFQGFGSYQNLAYGLLLLVVLLVIPQGLTSLTAPVTAIIGSRRKAANLSVVGVGDDLPGLPTPPARNPGHASVGSRADDGAPEPPMLDSRLIISDLSVSFGGNHVLRDLSAEFRVGFTGVLGPNGAGKTTLFNAITGYVRPTGGVITLNGEALTAGSPTRRAKNGVVRTFQTPRLVPEMTLTENVLLPSRRGASAGSRRRVAQELMELFGLGRLSNTRAEEVPLATLKVVEIVRALTVDPDVVLLDEPAAGLSAAEVDALLQTLAYLMNRRPRIVVVVEHDMEMVARLCNFAYMLNFGKILASGSPRDLLINPDVVSAYLGTANAPGN
jgi:ABC-type branched-subunit amino acid transport system ATPase component/ABC-type branched-subunit amino acid transport system permease subunit